MLGVSRTTVRSALQSLEQHGVLTRSPRRGTLVHGHLSPSMVALQRLIGFTRLLEEQGYTVETITTPVITSTPPADVGRALDLRAGARAYEISRLFVASGKPAIWAINYIPIGLFADRLFVLGRPEPAALRWTPAGRRALKSSGGATEPRRTQGRLAQLVRALA